MDWLQRTSALSNQLLLLAIFKESKRKKNYFGDCRYSFLFRDVVPYILFQTTATDSKYLGSHNSDTNGCVTEICYCHLYMSYKRFLKKIFRQLAGKEMITDSKKYPLLPLKTNDSTRVNDCLKLMIRYPTSKK